MHIFIALKSIKPIFNNLTDVYFRTLISTKQTNLWGENHSLKVTSQCKLSESPTYPVVMFPVKTAFHDIQITQAWTREVSVAGGDFTAQAGRQDAANKEVFTGLLAGTST